MMKTACAPSAKATRNAARRRGCAPVAKAAGMMLILATALLTVGCGTTLLAPAGTGGLPRADAERLSLIVAQTRAQFPQHSGGGIPYKTRGKAAATEREAGVGVEPALFGQGVGVQRGVQMGDAQRVTVELHLDKADYAEGYALATLPGVAAQKWPIVGFDKVGDPSGTFDFAYLLSDSEGRLRYLTVIGGKYEEEGVRYAGFEGTLVIPGQGNDLEHWSRVYKIDFGYRFPVEPSHQAKVNEATHLFNQLKREVVTLDSLKQEIAALDQKLATLRVKVVEPTAAKRHADEVHGAEERRDAARAELVQAAPVSEAKFIRYYELRRTLSDDYAAYMENNAHRWPDAAARQQIYDKWKTVEFHHPAVDELVTAYIVYIEDAAPLLKARKEAMDVIVRNDNWSKDPSRAAAPSPRTQQRVPQ